MKTKGRKTKTAGPHTLTEQVMLRVTPAEAEEWKARAAAEGRSLSNWIRRIVGAALVLALAAQTGCGGGPRRCAQDTVPSDSSPCQERNR